jgi:AhpD family alkylhydroperoxidase
MTTATFAAHDAARIDRPAGLARVWVARLLAAVLAANAAWMLFDPLGWFQAVPGAAEGGPFNRHFVGDIGIAYLAAAAALFAGSLAPARLSALALPAAVFLAGHALLHLVGYGKPAEGHGSWLGETLGVHLPALLTLWLALPAPPRSVAGAALAGRFTEAMIRLGERRLGVPLDYMREIAAAAPYVLRLLGRVSALGQSLRPRDRAAAHLAALGAALHDDCGTCVQIHINLARAHGVPEDTLRRAVMGEAGTLPAPLADAFRFGDAVAADDPELHELRERLERALGKRAVVEIAVGLAFARFYPMIKRALGHARSCATMRFDFAGGGAHGDG